MANNKVKPEEISIDKIFTNDDIYIIPLYQRSYAWKAEQIEKLIDDIADNIKGNDKDKYYYLGTMITNKKETGEYEVIDGQQRLITLYLLKLYLSKKEGLQPEPKEKSLQFGAREKYRDTLSRISHHNEQSVINDEFPASELYSGYNDIKRYFEDNKIDAKEFKKTLKNVRLVRVQVPEKIDLNSYFETMNTRGEQLELHHIAKAKILEKLDKDDRKIASDIWDCCADMDSYIQMNFDKNIRNKLFSETWEDLNKEINDWNNLTDAFINDNNKQSLGNTINDNSKQLPEKINNLKKILDSKDKIDEKSAKNTDETDKKERFESIISFPDFLLQVNAVINYKEDNDDNDEYTSLDDKRLIDTLKDNWENKENAQNFILAMLRCRTLFDKYIIKREYAGNYQDRGKWSLKRLEKYNNSASYKSTYSKEDSEDGDDTTKRLRTLQSALRITYTSPKSMRWITTVLKELYENKDEDKKLQDHLEKYCREKVEKSDYQNKKGFDIKRIVFSYLDYLLYRDGYKDSNSQEIRKFDENWEFQFRNSVEHFYPQNPDNKDPWDEKEELDGFGNLALITTSGNSQFSNMLPEDKIVVDRYKDIIQQSLKLCIMKKITNNHNKWTSDLAKKHREEMIKILKDDINEKKGTQ